MKQVTLQFNSAEWTINELRDGRFMQRGKIWPDTAPLSGAKHAQAFCRELQNLNGFYAVVRQTPDLLMAAVDHIRSIPLFYGQKDGRLFLADNAEWVRQQVGDQEMDALARDEFLLAGYVTGRDTLFPNVKQLQAGEYLIAELDVEGNISLACEYYYRFVHKEPAGYSESKLHSTVDSAAVNSVKRLIEYANGRQIVVPLSGGYDSRLIASLLKKAECENVLCYSYGRARNHEAEYSRKIAQSLGFAWCFAEYDSEGWAIEWGSSDAADFRTYAANHASLPHIQDWLAIKKLSERKLISPDAVVVPGHCCVTGYIPKSIVSGRFSEADFLQDIIGTHFSGRPISYGTFLTPDILKNKILCGELDFRDKHRVASRIMEINWAERQSKYIANSVRAYEQFGLDWWMPLWDREFTDVWIDIPLRLRLGREFYKAYVTGIYNSVVPGVEERVSGNSSDRSSFLLWLWSVARVLLPNFIIKYMKKKKNLKQYKKHFLGFGELMSDEELDSYLNSGYTIIGAYSSLYVQGKWGSGKSL